MRTPNKPRIRRVWITGKKVTYILVFIKATRWNMSFPTLPRFDAPIHFNDSQQKRKNMQRNETSVNLLNEFNQAWCTLAMLFIVLILFKLAVNAIKNPTNKKRLIQYVHRKHFIHSVVPSGEWMIDLLCTFERKCRSNVHTDRLNKKTQQQQRKFHLFFLPIWLLMDDIWTNSDFSSPFGSIVEWILIVYRTFLILKRNLLFSGPLRWSIPYLFQLFSFDCNWI